MRKKQGVHKRRAFLLVLTLVILAFDGGYGWLKYYSNQQQDSFAMERDAKFAQIDKQLADAKAAKKAKEDQTASANAALTDQQAGKVVTPSGCAIHGVHGDPTSIDVVVNKKHCFNPIDYAPSDLVAIDGATISAKVASDFDAMFKAAAAAGYPITVTSSYRSYQNQVTTYNGWVTANGSTTAADTVSARPGYSEHQSGFAMDLAAGNCALECFLTSGQYTWMTDHAADYGFIQRYPVGLTSITGYSDESWHYRYVGKAVAQDMKKKGTKTLEQYWNISGGGY
jgi:D-alanyl-D-alanine carboxypeptidase